MTTTSELPVGEIRDAFDRMERDRLFADAHQAEYMAVYPDEWIAILDEQLVGHDPNGVALIDRLRHAGVDVTRIYLRFLPVKTGSFIL